VAELSYRAGHCWAVFSRRCPSARSDILNSPKLAQELQGVGLGSLLPPKQIRLLEAMFLSNEVVSPNVRGGAGEGQVVRGGKRRNRTLGSLSHF
jgi:hypothetical protein